MGPTARDHHSLRKLQRHTNLSKEVDAIQVFGSSVDARIGYRGLLRPARDGIELGVMMLAPFGRSWSRRSFLVSCSLLRLPAASTKESLLPSEMVRYADPSTEFVVNRLTSPKYSSHLPEYY